MCIRDRGKTSVELTARTPLKGGDFAWVRISGTITEQTVDGHPVFYAVNTDISDVVRQQEIQNRVYEELTQSFEGIMDEYADSIYIADMETYELLYINKVACASMHMTR